MTEPTNPALRIDCAYCPAGRGADPAAHPRAAAAGCADCVVGVLLDVPAAPKRLPVPAVGFRDAADGPGIRRRNCQ